MVVVGKLFGGGIDTLDFGADNNVRKIFVHRFNGRVARGVVQPNHEEVLYKEG